MSVGHLLRESFSEAGLHLLDPLTHMRERAAEGLSMYGSIDRHFSEDGHRVTAEFILPVVEEYLRMALEK